MKLPILPSASEYPRKNILTPLLWLNAITFPGAAGSFMYSWQQGSILLAIAMIPFISVLFYYRHWSKYDPDRLQTEDYRIQQAYIAHIPQNLGYSDEQIPSRNAAVIAGSSKVSDDG